MMDHREFPLGSDLADVAPRLSGKAVMITGATGFIGGRLAERIALECSGRVRVLLRDSGKVGRLSRVRKLIEITYGAMDDPAALERAAVDCSIVFHCAYDSADAYANEQGLRSLIDLCASRKIRLVHVSTFATYAQFSEGELREEESPSPGGETYSQTKQRLEEMILEAIRDRALDATIILPTIVYGPCGGVWTVGPATQISDGTVILPEEGNGLCNAVYVDDVCQALVRAAVANVTPGRRYLISAKVPVTWREFFEGYARILGRPGPRCVAGGSPTREASAPGALDKPSTGNTGNGSAPQMAQRWRVRLRGLVGEQWKNRIRRLIRKLRNLGGRPVYAPDAQLTAFYSKKCHVRIDRAEAELGYRAQFTLDAGMRQTADWLRGRL